MNVGKVKRLTRYPVSSMGGEQLERANVSAVGIEHDRIFAVVDVERDEAAVPERSKRWHKTPFISSRISVSGGVEISFPDGEWLDGRSSIARKLLETYFDFGVEIRPYGLTPDQGPFATARYDRAPLHLITTGSLARLQEQLESSKIDAARFRPNIVVDTVSNGATPEREWVGGTLTIGSSTLRVVRPCSRCGFTTLAQTGLPADRQVLKKLIEGHDRDFGVLCDVVTDGNMSLGDSVSITMQAGAHE
jgi:uncharacterized protein YcbX